MKTPNYRAIVDSIMVAATKLDADCDLDIPLKKTFWDKRRELT